MRTRAAVVRESGAALPYAVSRPLVIEDVELEPPGRDEVLLRVGVAGLCHSDLSVINGNRPRPLPMALGHEAAGVVEQVGDGVHDLRPGDHVVMVFVPSCGHCLPCSGGRPALCEPALAANLAGTLLGGARRLRLGGMPLNHHLGCSAFAERAVVSRHGLVRIDRELAMQDAALFGCAVLTGVGAVVNTAQLPAGATTAVIGLGGVGLAALLGARAAGARRIVAIDLSERKRNLARELGATDVFDGADPECAEQVRAATGGGVDVAFEMAGSARAFETAYRITKRGGATVTAGLPPPQATFAMPLVSLVAEERTVLGSYIGTCVPQRDVPRFIDMYRRGFLPVNALASGSIALDDINMGFDRLHHGEVVRQLVAME